VRNLDVDVATTPAPSELEKMGPAMRGSLWR